VSFGSLPGVEVPSADKYVHVIFHFIFTVLWFLHFRSKNRKVSAVVLAVLMVLFSIVFGAFLELAQKWLTISRHADVYDILANSTGAILGAFAVCIYDILLQKGVFK
jgi:VanZ family protein